MIFRHIQVFSMAAQTFNGSRLYKSVFIGGILCLVAFSFAHGQRVLASDENGHLYGEKNVERSHSTETTVVKKTKTKRKVKRSSKKSAASSQAIDFEQQQRVWIAAVVALSLLFLACIAHSRWRAFAGNASFHAMRPWRVFVAAGVIFVIFAGSILDIALFQEHWPFSNYPMFSRIRNPNQFKLVRAYGVTPDGKEVYSAGLLAPAGRSRLKRTLNTARPDEYDRIARNLLSLYRKKQNPSVELAGVRIYRCRWEIDPELKNRDHPERTLLGEARMEDAP